MKRHTPEEGKKVLTGTQSRERSQEAKKPGKEKRLTGLLRPSEGHYTGHQSAGKESKNPAGRRREDHQVTEEPRH